MQTRSGPWQEKIPGKYNRRLQSKSNGIAEMEQKHSVSQHCYLFAHLHFVSSDSFSSLIFFSSLTLRNSVFWSVHIVGNLTSKLPSPSSTSTATTIHYHLLPPPLPLLPLLPRLPLLRYFLLLLLLLLLLHSASAAVQSVAVASGSSWAAASNLAAV